MNMTRGDVPIPSAEAKRSTVEPARAAPTPRQAQKPLLPTDLVDTCIQEALACRAAATARVMIVTGADSDFHAAAKPWLDQEHDGQTYPAAESVVIADAGHMVHFEQPGRLAAAVEAFLGRHL